MISNSEKIKIVQDRINMLLIHVPALENDILANPLKDHSDKPTRATVLNNILKSIEALEAELESLGGNLNGS